MTRKPRSATPDFLTVARAAKILNVSDRRIRALIASGRLPAVRVGQRTWIIKPTDLSKIRVRKPGRPKRRRIQ